MDNDNNTELLGKKIFFLHPSAFVQNEVISELIQLEYEVYIVKDENALLRVLRKYPHSIVFCGVDEGPDTRGWESLIRRIMENPETKETAIGAITASQDDAAKQFYAGSLNLPCGYLAIKPDVHRSIKVIQDILAAAEAKGRRKYIRADTRDDHQAIINLNLDGRYINGNIWDISVVGLSCVFPGNAVLEKNTLINDIQLKLQSFLLKVEGIVFGSRVDGNETVYVVVFTQKIDPLVRTRIRTYMQKHLQVKMDQEMK